MKKRIPLILLLISLFAFCQHKKRDLIQAPGIVQAEIITLKALVSGTVEELTVTEGEKVRSGTLIAKINSEKLENLIKDTEINLRDLDLNRQRLEKKLILLEANQNYLKRQFQRYERLQKSAAISGESLERIRLQYQEAETAFFDSRKALETIAIQQERIANQKQNLLLQLKDFQIISPVDGLILEIYTNRGETLLPGASVADIYDLKSLYVEVFLEARELATLKINDQVSIKIDGLADRQFSGKISSFSQKAEFSPKYIISEKEREALLYKVKVNVNSGAEFFKIGMPVTVYFQTSKDQ